MSQRPKFATTLPSPEPAISRPRIVPPSDGPSTQQPEPGGRAASPSDQSLFVGLSGHDIGILRKALRTCFQQRNTEQRQWLELNLPDKTEGEFLAMLPEPEFDESWTEDDERRLLEDWGSHVLKRALMKKVNIIDAFTASVKEEYALWRVTVTYLNCLPSNIISDRRYGMMYEARFKINRQGSELDGNLAQATRALWTQWFCKLLSKLTLHPAWEGNYRLYRTAIQYTVISATDDSRPWDCDVRGVDSVFLHAFSKAARQTDGRRTYSAIHNTVLDNLAKDHGNLRQTSWWSKLFKSIEQQTRSARRKVRAAGLSRVVNGKYFNKPYLVHSTDLAILEEAVRVADQVYGGNAPFTPEAWVRTVKPFTGGHKYVVNKDLFEKGMDAVWLNYLRMSRRSEGPEKRAQRRNAPDNANNDNGDNSNPESMGELVDLTGSDEDEAPRNSNPVVDDSDSEDMPLIRRNSRKGKGVNKGKAVNKGKTIDTGKSIDRTEVPGPGPSSHATVHAASRNPVGRPKAFPETSQLRLPGASASSTSAFPAVRGFTAINSLQESQSYDDDGDDEDADSQDDDDEEDVKLPVTSSLSQTHAAGDNAKTTKIHRGVLPTIRRAPAKRVMEDRDSGSDGVEDTARPQKRHALPFTASEYRHRHGRSMGMSPASRPPPTPRLPTLPTPASRPAFNAPTAPMLNASLNVLAAAAPPATRVASQASQPKRVAVVYDIKSGSKKEEKKSSPPHADLVVGPKGSGGRRSSSK
ncbi:hypothetical protein B0T19DRAFT_470578 [Cercophora scortea]|uniref:Uncharacterized protein n=1 Tax=Cercophora scortea TaxID=314031 RepID=A0AAE0J1M4_9PEZI|nr:hypothetical protein B0T19DRAFT_470578 [Cercophora scortea]